MRKCSICREYGHNKRTCKKKVMIERLLDFDDLNDEYILKEKDIMKSKNRKKWYKRMYYKFISLFR